MLSTNSLLGVTKDKLSCTQKNEFFTNKKVMRGKEIMNQRIWVNLTPNFSKLEL